MNSSFSDGLGRKIDYLRISVTDRCNLKCDYCRPSSIGQPPPMCNMLKFRDLLRLVSIFAALGTQKFRITGGEPLVRKGVLGFIRQVGRTPGVKQVALTTNGLFLARMAAPLKEAGVKIVNISLDSLQAKKYAAITGADMLPEALNGVEAALKAGFDAVKINMVVMRGVNDDEVEDFARLTIDNRAQVRFIEYMPATPSAWTREKYLAMDQVMERVSALGSMAPEAKAQWGGPAKIYKLAGAKGEVGFISPVSSHFCDSCNRLRLTADGSLLQCLFSLEKLALAPMLAGGASDQQIAQAIAEHARVKPAVRDMETYAQDMGKSMMGVGG
ncbi:MAG: GTP 3',8-cyclase MoaA [Nitrospinota bacterium]|nr:GTP 3',8-cyclase MoaA [Nitrospinota bacterium]